MELRTAAYDHPHAAALIEQLQQVYRDRYGDVDATPVDPAEFAPPLGLFLVGYLDGEPVACGGWRAQDGPELEFQVGDAELKRMYVVPRHQGRGLARVVLAELERRALAAGRRRLVLETGTRQPEAIGLYTSSGYQPIPGFGIYRDDPLSRCFGKVLDPARSPAA